ncbi:uncharacterized protein EI90DRAFT_3114910 [Cantharellus anzutake]|uniref:uncharacterized protein n=1 Tax=Cantharellus anzutake TaxID=1750568 RepID=UPI001903A962|nr:uncharacterized protein EI90DRAFT_3114910 [Cantharellus anzutake]KAF8344182.1 hypothetical protein EI90DRAFT_3114910 [Cantharellus anzutake]
MSVSPNLSPILPEDSLLTSLLAPRLPYTWPTPLLPHQPPHPESASGTMPSMTPLLHPLGPHWATTIPVPDSSPTLSPVCQDLDPSWEWPEGEAGCGSWAFTGNELVFIEKRLESPSQPALSGSPIETDPLHFGLSSSESSRFLDLETKQLGTLTSEESFNLLPESASDTAMSTQEQIQQLFQALLTAQATQAGQALPPSPRPPKVATPSPFNGDRERLDDFLAQCRLYLSLHHTEYPDDQQQILFVLSHMKEGTAAPWASQKINAYLSSNAAIPMLDNFLQELKDMFADPNRAATAMQKLSDARQGISLVETVIQLFELHGPPSGLGETGLIDKFQRAITHCLRESIYGSHPFPTTWEDWKQHALLLDNQHRRFNHSRRRCGKDGPSGTSLIGHAVGEITVTLWKPIMEICQINHKTPYDK